VKQQRLSGEPLVPLLPNFRNNPASQPQFPR
jgi:hypothetical protein